MSAIDNTENKSTENKDTGEVLSFGALDSGKPQTFDDLVGQNPEDSIVMIDISGDRLHAYLTITEARDGGAPATIEMINKEIRINNIRHGVDHDMINKMLNENIFSKKTCIATGTAAVEPVNGSIDYYFKPDSTLAPKELNYGEVDYRDLGLVTNIYSGTDIMKVNPVIDGADGIDVCGNPIVPMPGKEAKYIVGAGTEFDEETGIIRAMIDGNLTWEKDKFVVSEELVIKDSVDVSTGNIDFIGNVVIKSEIKESFTVKSAKNISVSGSVIGATLIADGDITLNMGCINSDVMCKGNLKMAFCETSKIECDGDILTQSFVGCDVFCGGTITVTSGKGVVVGGKYIAIEGFSANIIGSETYTKTHITLGNGAVLTEERLAQTARIQALEEQALKLAQIIELLQQHKKSTGQLSPERETMLTSAIRSRFTNQREIKQRTQRINELDDLLSQTQELYVIARKELWPGVSVRINSDLINSDQHFTKIMVSKDAEGNLAFLPLTK